MTANLQSSLVQVAERFGVGALTPKVGQIARSSAWMTVKMAASAFNVSERSVYMARKVMKLRPDLEAEIMTGKLSLNAALRITENKSKPTSFERLQAVWNSASQSDCDRLLGSLPRCTP